MMLDLSEVKDILSGLEAEAKTKVADALESAKTWGDEKVAELVAHLRGSEAPAPAAEPEEPEGDVATVAPVSDPEADASGAADPAPTADTTVDTTAETPAEAVPVGDAS